MDRVRGDWPQEKAQSDFELIETAIYQSIHVRDLNDAYRKLTDRRASDARLTALYEYAGPAKLVTLVLRGYESPDLAMRQASNDVVLALASHFDRLSLSRSLTEDFWLMLGQQQDVLLELIERDLEAYAQSEMTEAQAAKERMKLGNLHKLLRSKPEQILQSWNHVGATL